MELDCSLTQLIEPETLRRQAVLRILDGGGCGLVKGSDGDPLYSPRFCLPNLRCDTPGSL